MINKPIRNKRVKYRIVNDFAILFLPPKKILLQNVALDIWKLSNGKNKFDSIIKKLYKLYNVDKNKLEKDVVSFFYFMEEKGFIDLIFF